MEPRRNLKAQYVQARPAVLLAHAVARPETQESPRMKAPALPRNRHDTSEVALGYDAYVVFPDLAARQFAPRQGAMARVQEWSRRIRRLLADATVRAIAAVSLTTFAWLCQRPG